MSGRAPGADPEGPLNSPLLPHELWRSGCGFRNVGIGEPKRAPEPQDLDPPGRSRLLTKRMLNYMTTTLS